MSHYVPNTTQTPDILFDRWLAVLSGSEFKVLMYLVRRTYGFGKPGGDSIALRQLVSGISRTSGTALDWGCGLDRDTVLCALDVLCGLGLVERQHQQDAAGGTAPNHWTINLHAPVVDRDVAMQQVKQLRAAVKGGGKNPTGEGGGKNRPPQTEKDPLGEGEEFPPGGRENAVLPQSEESDPQQTVRQQTVFNKQHQQTERASEVPAPPATDVVVDAPRLRVSDVSETPESVAETAGPIGIADQLIAVGMTSAVAQDLAQKFPERCAKQLEYLPWRRVAGSPGGFLNRAIRENYAAPTAFLESQKTPKPPLPVRPQPTPEQLQAQQQRRDAKQAGERDLQQLLERVESDHDLFAEVEKEAIRRLPQVVRESKTKGTAYQQTLRGKIVEVVKQWQLEGRIK